MNNYIMNIKNGKLEFKDIFIFQVQEKFLIFTKYQNLNYFFMFAGSFGMTQILQVHSAVLQLQNRFLPTFTVYDGIIISFST